MSLHVFFASWLMLMAFVEAQEPPSRELKSVPEDLVIPEISEGAPAAGKRVSLTVPGYEGSAAHHILYLPTDWQPGKKYPVLFEYPGNGGFKNKLGDTCDGTPESCHLGYGLSGGHGFIWVSLPFVEVVGGKKLTAIHWWGDVEETVRYCEAAAEQTCAQFGGNKDELILSGFSRGAIACNYIGLHDDKIAALWKGFLSYSHYDGARTNWPYAGADRASALERLKRLHGRLQFISAEMQTTDIEQYLAQTGVTGDFTFVPIPFPNHNDRWALRDIPERQKAREWLARVLKGGKLEK
jgi:hypothetical protein